MKSYLSQVDLPLVWALKNDFENPYRLHQWIWGTLPQEPDARRDFLFRSDVKGTCLRILLLSARAPVNGGTTNWKTTEVSSTFLGHDAYRFQLRANPTFRRASDHRRIAIFDEQKLRDWFARKLSGAGCEVSDMELSDPRKIQFRKGDGTKPGTFYSVDASGLLSVHDEKLFRSAFDAGIGPAKGFGFGLLLLQPVQL